MRAEPRTTWRQIPKSLLRVNREAKGVASTSRACAAAQYRDRTLYQQLLAALGGPGDEKLEQFGRWQIANDK